MIPYLEGTSDSSKRHLDETSKFCKIAAFIMDSFSIPHQQMLHVRMWKDIFFLSNLLTSKQEQQ